ncbi:MAG TPA: calcium-binding protein, partial [Burkholderiales bacterium]
AFNVQPGPAVIESLGGAQVFVDNQGAGDRFAIDGGTGNDSVTANGTGGDDIIGIARDSANSIAVFAAGGQPVSITNVEQLLVEGGAGNDTIAGQNGIATFTHLTIDGGAGNDTILGGDGDDTLLGGTGNDFVDGNRGNDIAQLGAGDDTFQWDPGDGSDVVEGDSGNDTLQFNGSNAAENMVLSANGSHALLTRNVASVTMDLHGIENVNIRALGSADNINVGDLTGTDVKQVHVDLGDFAGDGDGAADQVAANGTSGADHVVVTGAAGAASVTGLPADVNLTGAEGTLDSLQVNLGGGNDVFDASGLAADVVQLTVVGGTGADLMIGSQGNDSFVWNPGDGSDTLEGQGGVDTMLFNGANIAETIDISANGSRALFTRDVAGITMDLNDVERIAFNALGGADNIAVNDLSGTDVTEVDVNLAQAGGGGDGAQDNVTVNATGGDDVIVLAGDVAGISVLGLAAQVNVTGAEGALDKLHIVGGAGDDVIQASDVAPGSIGLVLDGGEGDDVIIGSAGDDVLIGGPGDDVLIGNGGHDTFQAAPGNDTVIQGFAAGGGSQDVIDLRGIAGAQDFAWVLAHASDVDGNAVIDLGGGAHMTLDNVDVASLHSDNFLMS